MKRIIYTIACLLIGVTIQAQETLSLDDAFAIAIENNFDIKIEKQNLKSSEVQANRGNAGYYPTVAANSSYEHSISNTEAEYDFGMAGGAMPATGEQPAGTNNSVIEGDGVNTTTFQAGIGVEYVLFEGFAKKYRYNELLTQRNISSLALKAQIEQSFVEVANAYMSVAKAQAVFDLAKENTEISRERAKRARVDQEYGSGTGLRYLQSLTFLNNDSVELKSALVELNNSKKTLNLLLGQDPETEILVTNEVEILPQFNLDILRQKAQENNTMLKMAEKRITLSENYLSQAKSTYSPSLSVGGNYGYYRQENEQNLILYNENLGFTGNVTLSIPIFTGNQRKIRVQASKIKIHQEEYNREKSIMQVETELSKTYEMYSFFLSQLSTELENIELYERTYKKANSDYINGLTNSTEVRDAQMNLASAKNRISALQYSIKVYEIMLQQMSGELVDNQ